MPNYSTWQGDEGKTHRLQPLPSPPLPQCQRLLAAGKPEKLALVAPMESGLLTIFNAMLKHRTPWRALYTAIP
jgi:hypothetical protein